MWLKFVIFSGIFVTTLVASSKTLNCVNPFLLSLLKHKLKSKVVVQKITTTLAPPDCICVPYYQCDANNTIITDGLGIVDIRPRRCTGDLEVCCKPPKQPSPQPPPQPSTQPPISSTPSLTFSTSAAPASMTTTSMMPGTSMKTSTSPPTSPTRAPIITTMSTPMMTNPTSSQTITTPPTRPASPPTLPSAMPTSPPTRPTSPPTRPTSPPTISTSPTRPTSSQTMSTQPPTRPTSPSTRPISPPTATTTSRPVTSSSSSPTTPRTSRMTTTLTTRPITFTPPPTSLQTSTQSPPMDCICVPTNLCDADGYVITNGEGIINPRLTSLPCTSANEVCCKVRNGDIRYSTSLPTFRPGTPMTSTSPTMTSTTTMISTLPMTTITTTTTIINTSTSMPTYQTSMQTSANICVCVPPSQCDSNGFVIVSGAGNINPRFPGFRQSLATNNCVSPEVCCKLSPTNEDYGVIFPDESSVAIDPRANGTSQIKNAGTQNACRCVKSASCSAGNEVQLDAAGIIDSRFRLCLPADEVCCRLNETPSMLVSTTPTTTANSSRVINRGSFPNKEGACGVQGPPCKPENCPKDEGLAYFAEFPWMVALLSRQNTGQALFMCGGSLINPRAVLTATHCVLNHQKGTFIARFGEYDTSTTNESLPYQEVEIQAIVTHPQYYSGGLYNDIAVLILETPIVNAVNVVPICLPEKTTIFDAKTRCLASGWGKDAFDGKYQKVLQKIDLPIVERTECQNRLRNTRLGKYFQLHSSFMCAGGEESKDTCTGDGGGPLVCPTPTGQYIQVGIVSWGIGCGESNVPAVYIDVAQYRQWIDQQLSSYGLL